jgi:hypothetical protein
MSIILNGTSGITAPTYAGTVTAEYSVPVTAFKNRIINGAMMIDQRNAGASVTPTADGTYTLDRWRASLSQASKFSVQRNAGSVTPPAGYINYLGITSLSTYSVTATDSFSIQQNIEGLNLSDLGWGAASAQTVTLSFWIRSSLTGTFGGVINNGSYNRSYPFTYTISSANTWEQKTVTIAGDTTGTWITTNGIGMVISFDLGTGSTYKTTAGAWAAGYYNSSTGATSVVGTNGATFYITGVQLEKGSTATSFDYRPYGTELSLCQRYYYQEGGTGTTMLGSGYYRSSGIAYFYKQFSTTMRASPTFSATSGTNYYSMECGAAVSVTGNTLTSYNTSPNSAGVYFTVAGGTASSGCIVMTNSTSAIVGWSAEL